MVQNTCVHFLCKIFDLRGDAVSFYANNTTTGSAY